MSILHVRPVNPEKDFPFIAPLLSSQEETPTSEAALREDYARNKANILCLTACEGKQGNFLGFAWAWQTNADPELTSFFLVVKPVCRCQGAGKLLYDEMLRVVTSAGKKRLHFNLPASETAGKEFAERRGFRELWREIGMELDLKNFDDKPWDADLERLKFEGFRFTSMAELGNTEEAQQKLYALNDAASASTLGQRGEHPWASFEDFQKAVCQSEWYRPDGQVIAIDTRSGNWAAMSAITRMKDRDHAYNLFTGVDVHYRGRKLGQAVKVLALRYARSHLGVGTVRTNHNTQNLPMIAIDKKFGYRLLPESYLLMEKVLE